MLLYSVDHMDTNMVLCTNSHLTRSTKIHQSLSEILIVQGMNQLWLIVPLIQGLTLVTIHTVTEQALSVITNLVSISLIICFRDIYYYLH